MLTINIELIASLLGILVIAAGSILFMVRLWNKVDNTLIKHTMAVDGLIQEVTELKGYGEQIQRNAQSIAVINERCKLNHRKEN